MTSRMSVQQLAVFSNQSIISLLIRQEIQDKMKKQVA